MDVIHFTGLRGTEYTRSDGRREEVKLMPVRWREMVPLYPGYFIGDNGEMIGRRGHVISPQLTDNGSVRYAVLDLDGKIKFVRASRVVCWHFNGPPPDDEYDYQVWHKDENVSNNHYRNLEWRKPLKYQEKEKPEVIIPASGLAAAYLGQVPGLVGIWAFRKQVFDPEKMRNLMKKRGIIGLHLSASSGISQPSISEWLTGRKVPGAKNILVLAVALDADVSDFLTVR